MKFVEKNGIYVEMQLFAPITLAVFLQWVKDGLVVFDTAMYEGNNRPYCQFRSQNSDIAQFAYKVLR